VRCYAHCDDYSNLIATRQEFHQSSARVVDRLLWLESGHTLSGTTNNDVSGLRNNVYGSWRRTYNFSVELGVGTLNHYLYGLMHSIDDCMDGLLRFHMKGWRSRETSVS